MGVARGMVSASLGGLLNKVTLHHPNSSSYNGLPAPASEMAQPTFAYTGPAMANPPPERQFPPPLQQRHYTIIKELGDGSFGTVWLADWHSELHLPPGTTPPGPSKRPEYAGKRLVALKRMKKPFQGGWPECMALKELRVSIPP